MNEEFSKIIYIKQKNKNKYIVINTRELRVKYNNLEFLDYCVEIINSVLDENNKFINVIIDLFEFKLKYIKFKFITKCIKTFNNKFPDLLNKAIVINPSSGFLKLFKLVKIFVEKETLKKIEIRNDNLNNDFNNNYIKQQLQTQIQSQLNQTI